MESSFSMNYFSSSSSSTSSTTNTPSPPPLPPPPPHPNSRAVGEAESLTFKKLPSSQYKGVVPQPNGRWGAQIYEKHRRVWLGTFNMERDAARAYDLAAQRFRGRDAATNFPPLSPPNAGGGASNRELSFLLSRSKAEIVDMLRKHTYLDELLHFSPPSSSAGGGPVDPPASPARPARELLFEKSVTPSDVGKLNRLVIPKQHAEKHFPAAGGGALLQFEEAGGGGGKVWRFRYSYWNSSQSYVLTKGWSRFVKEKGLAAGDSVCFYRSGGSDGEGQRQLYIECRPRGAGGGALMVRLFGVNIMKAAAAAPGMGGWGNENGKRSTLEGVEMGWMKKQCVGGL